MSKHIVIRELITSSTYHPVDRNGKVDYEDVVMENDEPFVSDYIAVMREDNGTFEIVEDGFKTLDEAWTACDKYNEGEGENQEVKYICVNDYQGTGFHIGDTQTAEEWKEWALSMNEIEESENYDTFAKLDPVEAVDYIADMWQIEIVEFDPTNPEHVELRKAYEEEF